MCGLCGLINADINQPVGAKTLSEMTRSLSHRGPDDYRTFIQHNAGLGHCRLAIIDTSPNGAQPMSNENNSIWLVCNGEIYNHLEQRDWLLKKGHQFKSHSDSEVILHLYEELGEECLSRLHGMFAFALWDANNQKLFLARDRIGKKPLFYAPTLTRILFGSEIKSLLRFPELIKEPDSHAIDHFITLSYIPAPQTGFKGIYKLPPAHKLIWQNNQIRIECYWQLLFQYQPAPFTATVAQIQTELIDRLREAVRIRLMSDVELGVFLSGGIDSSAIVGLMSQLVDHPVKTFSISFNEKSHDESSFARLIARHFKTDHHEFIYTPELANELPAIVDHLDEPFGDASILPTWFLAKMTKPYVSVALNGDGGDENFAGYDRYLHQKIAQMFWRIPTPLRNLNRCFFNAVTPGNLPNDHLLKRVQNFFMCEKIPGNSLYCRWISIINRQEREGLYSADFLNVVKEDSAETLIINLMQQFTGIDGESAPLYTDIMSYLPDDLLVKMDRATMAHGVEARSPFLDHTFMEFAARLPISLKIKGLNRKWILKKALSNLLPKAIVTRSKRGFAIPVDVWLRKELNSMLREVLLSKAAGDRGYFNQERVKVMLDQHLKGQKNWQYQLWNLLILELWFLQKFDN